MDQREIVCTETRLEKILRELYSEKDPKEQTRLSIEFEQTVIWLHELGYFPELHIELVPERRGKQAEPEKQLQIFEGPEQRLEKANALGTDQKFLKSVRIEPKLTLDPEEPAR